MFKELPQTEMDYWRAIQDCEQTTIKISEKLRSASKKADIVELRRTMQQTDQVITALLAAIEHKFGVFCYRNHPQGTLRPGKKESYIEWSNRMEQTALELKELQEKGS